MIGEKMLKALNKQMNIESYNAYLYLSMSAYYESINLSGFAHWMRVQFKEEQGHAKKIYDHINERMARIAVTGMDAPPTEWKSPLDAFEAAFNHEVKVSGMIDDLVELAKKEKDNAALLMLQWFVDEQVEEENSTGTIVEKLRMIGDNKGALFMLDSVLGKRE